MYLTKMFLSSKDVVQVQPSTPIYIGVDGWTKD